VWANVDLDSYDRLIHVTHFAVNDIGMASFFALATKEVVESTAPGGALHSPRRAGMPLLAAIGGMAGPALIFCGARHRNGPTRTHDGEKGSRTRAESPRANGCVATRLLVVYVARADENRSRTIRPSGRGVPTA
jgi:hypothetical protein